jgi:hypothetical protein
LKKTAFAALFCALTLAGCGAAPSVVAPGAVAAGSLQALKKAANPSYDAGLAAGLNKADALHQAKTPARHVRLPQGETDQNAYDRGYVCGLLQGSMNSYARVKGSFSAEQWAAFANMNYQAMKDALNALKANPELAAKYAKAEGILEGGIEAYEGISGSFDSSQWKSFTDANYKVLSRALDAMKG